MNTRRLVNGAGLLLLMCFSSAAVAQDFRKLVMPGRVIEAHADIEGDCNNCHDLQSQQPMDALCITCHEDIGEDRDNGEGFHGRFEAARRNDCVICHTDHEGRDADIAPVEGGVFDHVRSDFALGGAHFGTPCGSCHAAGKKHRDAPVACVDCHANDDIHEGTLGSDCQDCHADSGWSDENFDHSTTAYTLTGAHADAGCVDCHRGNVYKGTPARCVSCHAVDDVHDGGKGKACNDCHTTARWQGVRFDHLAETGFALRNGHSGLNCQDCHTREDFKDSLESSCVACHRGEDDHQGRFGKKCESCHVATGWSESLFDHDDTDFALRDSHAELHCSACHKGNVGVSLPAVCGGCHLFDDSHGGQLGENCGSCHQQSRWLAAIEFDHDLSEFPLIGMHAIAPCASCHQSNQFHDASRKCVDCHREEDIHRGALGDACSGCHTSNAWQAATFDHDTNTSFPLDGGHSTVECDACHRDTSSALSDVPSTCGGCHRADDIHVGQFGSKCAKCHSTSSFSVIENL